MELDAESDLAVDFHMVQDRRWNHLGLATFDHPHDVGSFFEDEADRSALHDETPPHSVGDLMCFQESRGNGALVEDRSDTLSFQSGRQFVHIAMVRVTRLTR